VAMSGHAAAPATRIWRSVSRVGALVATIAAAAGLTPTANAAQLIGRDATGVRLAVNAQGVALVTYRSGGKVNHVLARGAVNALPPSTSRSQVRFQVDYAGGKGFFGHPVWQTFSNVCTEYDGPVLYAVVAACKAPDGSYWAVQSWQQALPDLGFPPWLPQQESYWLELSHWTGPLAQLEVYQGWVYDDTYRALFGRYTYQGIPVHGFGTTRYGVPTDSYGRLIYLDTYNSVYGSGWRRENSFVSHNPSGALCYGFFRFNPTKGGYQHPPGQTAVRGPGFGSEYRFIAAGPGVTPLVSWTGPAEPEFDPNEPADIIADLSVSAFVGKLGSKLCTKGLSHTKAGYLLALQNNFKASLSNWDQPAVSAGARVSTSTEGLTFTLPAGAKSSAEITTADQWDAHHSPAFVDLGSTGVPAGATFSMLLHPALGGAGQYAGARIEGGRLELVTHYHVWNSSTDSWQLPATDTVVAGASYDPSQMRWLWIWERNFAQNDQGPEVWFAPSVTGPWTRLGGVGGFSYSAKAWLSLGARGDGSATLRLTVGSLNEPPPPPTSTVVATSPSSPNSPVHVSDVAACPTSDTAPIGSDPYTGAPGFVCNRDWSAGTMTAPAGIGCSATITGATGKSFQFAILNASGSIVVQTPAETIGGDTWNIYVYHATDPGSVVAAGRYTCRIKVDSQTVATLNFSVK